MIFFLVLVLIIPLSFLEGWVLMLLVGMVHHQWLPMLPTVGYWPAVFISAMFSLWISIVRFNPDSIGK